MLISLVGLPGAGKSTIGRLLATCMDLPFVDCDGEFVRQAGMPISQFFASEGEVRFRAVESALLEELTGRSDGVLATGGGAVLSDANRALLRSRSICIWLQADLGSIADRLSGSTDRPLLAHGGTDRLAALKDERQQLYEAVSAHAVRTDARSAEAIVEELAGLLGAYRPAAAAR